MYVNTCNATCRTIDQNADALLRAKMRRMARPLFCAAMIAENIADVPQPVALQAVGQTIAEMQAGP
jgi:hypothetical protein